LDEKLQWLICCYFFDVEEHYFTEPESQEASLGSYIRILCHSPVSEVEWYRMEDVPMLWHNLVPGYLDSNQSVHMLSIMGVEESNYGTYVCQYQDEAHGNFVSFYSKSAVVRSGRISLYLCLVAIAYSSYR